MRFLPNKVPEFSSRSLGLQDVCVSDQGIETSGRRSYPAQFCQRGKVGRATQTAASERIGLPVWALSSVPAPSSIIQRSIVVPLHSRVGFRRCRPEEGGNSPVGAFQAQVDRLLLERFRNSSSRVPIPEDHFQSASWQRSGSFWWSQSSELSSLSRAKLRSLHQTMPTSLELQATLKHQAARRFR